MTLNWACAAQAAESFPPDFGIWRSRPLEATVGALAAHAKAMGVTRVANVTYLDRIGIPVVMAVRPASRNLSVTQGKGVSLLAAVASGLGEALEYHCAERIAGPVLAAPLRDHGADRPWLVPRGLLVRHRRMDGWRIPWSAGTDLLTGEEWFVPSEVVFGDFATPPPDGQGHFRLSTNGLAVGNTRSEALLHALCEVIERDALALFRVRGGAGKRPPSIDLRTIGAPAPRMLLDRLEAAGLSATIWDMTSDIDVPCFLCQIGEPPGGEIRPRSIFSGTGCHPSADIALCRAISEAAQSRLTVIAGARDDLHDGRYEDLWTEPPEELFGVKASVPLQTAHRTWPEPPSTIEGSLDAVLARLQERAIGPIAAVELPCPVPGFSCIRIIAPALEQHPDFTWYRRGRRAQQLAGGLQ